MRITATIKFPSKQSVLQFELIEDDPNLYLVLGRPRPNEMVVIQLNKNRVGPSLDGGISKNYDGVLDISEAKIDVIDC